MKNPFANFDLEESLSGLPDGLREPMVLAVVASGLVHGFTFLLLPVLTTSAEAKNQGTERIVSVVELTPEEQAKLPVTMTAVNPLVNPLAPGALSKVPLTGLFPSSTTPGIQLTPNPNPVNDFFNNVNKSSSGSTGSLGLGSYSLGNPIITGSSNLDNGLDAAERKRLRELEKADAERKAKEAEAKAKQEEEAKQTAEQKDQKNDPKNQTQVDPGGQNNSPTPPGTQPGTPSTSATQLQPTPALIAATTYGLPEGADKPEYVTQQSQQLQNSILTALLPEALRNLPSDNPQRQQWETANQDQIGKTAIYMATQLQPQTITARPAPLPPGITEFKFNGAPPQTQVNAVIEVYVTPEGKLMAAPTLVRSSGFKPVRYTVLFDLPSAKPAA
jgi:hypothetical protein